jgi:hypothetical protein
MARSKAKAKTVVQDIWETEPASTLDLMKVCRNTHVSIPRNFRGDWVLMALIRGLVPESQQQTPQALARPNDAYSRRTGKPRRELEEDVVAYLRRLAREKFNDGTPVYALSLQSPVEGGLKLGFNPQARYRTTPAGLYAYPLTRENVQLAAQHGLPYRAEAEHYVLLRRTQPDDTLVIRRKDDATPESIAARNKYKEIRGAVLWNDGEDNDEKSSIFRFTQQLLAEGITSVLDLGSGTIHRQEKSQIVFLSPRAYDVVDVWRNEQITGLTTKKLQKTLRAVDRSEEPLDLSSWTESRQKTLIAAIRVEKYLPVWSQSRPEWKNLLAGRVTFGDVEKLRSSGIKLAALITGLTYRHPTLDLDPMVMSVIDFIRWGEREKLIFAHTADSREEEAAEWWDSHWPQKCLALTGWPDLYAQNDLYAVLALCLEHDEAKTMPLLRNNEKLVSSGFLTANKVYRAAYNEPGRYEAIRKYVFSWLMRQNALALPRQSGVAYVFGPQEELDDLLFRALGVSARTQADSDSYTGALYLLTYYRYSRWLRAGLLGDASLSFVYAMKTHLEYYMPTPEKYPAPFRAALREKRINLKAVVWSLEQLYGRW